jgi:glycosyltransferase involved in cell wall biosynthesis
MKNPILTIGMPVYNGEQYIRQAIDSLLCQSFTDFELLISDNCSTDGTQEICLEYASKDKRISYLRQETNIGLERNYTFVVNIASGEFFMWASYDDIWHSDFVEKLIKGFVDPQISTVFCPVCEIDESGNRSEHPQIYDYEGEFVLTRIFKFWMDSKASRDTMIYGIHRISILKNLKLKPFLWPNNDRPDGVGDFMASYILSSGKYRFIYGDAFFTRRVTLNPPRKQGHMRRTLLSEILHAMTLDVQVSFRCLISIWSCSKSFMTFILSIPIFFIYLIKASTFRILPLFGNKLKKFNVLK